MPYPHMGRLGFILRRHCDKAFMVEDPVTGTEVERAAFDFTRDLEHTLLFDAVQPEHGGVKDHKAPLRQDGEFSIVVTRKTAASGQVEYRAEFWYPAEVPA